MTSKTTNKFSPAVRERAVRLVLDHAHEHPSRWQAIVSISAKIGCSAHSLHEWVRKAEVDAGKRADVGHVGEAEGPSERDPAQGIGIFRSGGA